MTLKEIYCKLVDKWCYYATLEIQEPALGATDWKDKTDNARHHAYRCLILMIHFDEMFPQVSIDYEVSVWAREQMNRVMYLRSL